MPAAAPRVSPPLPANAALLLDLDGTLLDIAPTPTSVVVPPELPGLLRRLGARLGGALALVSGRTIAEIDALLPEAPFAVAGEHGCAIRFAPGAAVEREALPEMPAFWAVEAEALARAHRGALMERKAHGLVLHYRQAPEAGEALYAGLVALLAGAGEEFAILPGKMIWEVKPRGVDKGSAVARLMARPPFAGRLPVFVGDDVTDEDGFRAARALGGWGLEVAECFGDAAGVRAWLSAQAEAHFA